MCFYTDDYDWYASINEKSTKTSPTPVRCDECQRMIPAGEPYTHIFLQENDPDDWDGDETEDFDQGETFDYDQCDLCSKLLEAIEAEELERGCPPHNSRPYLGQMNESVAELDRADRLAYVARARAMFPGIEVPKSWEEED